MRRFFFHRIFCCFRTASSAASSAVAKLDKVKVAVPNDTTNEARALTLLEKNGFFK